MTDARRKIPTSLRRRVLIETRHRCAVCRYATVEVHHIVPWREHRRHDYANLIALCPNCHALADTGAIDRPSLCKHKARAISSQLHEIVSLALDASGHFSEWGPESLSIKQRASLIVHLRARSMLAGVIRNLEWPLLRCELCEAIAPIDSFWTPQDDWSSDDSEPVRTYCNFGCVQHYQQLLRKYIDTDEGLLFYQGEYYVENTSEMIRNRL